MIKSLIQLPDGVVSLILSFSEYFEQLQCCLTHSSLYPLWKNYFRRITLTENSFKDAELLPITIRVRDCYQQVGIDYYGAVRFHEISLEPQGIERLHHFYPVRAVHSLICTLDLFTTYYQHQFDRIASLSISNWDEPVTISHQKVQTLIDNLSDRIRDLQELTISGYDFPSLPRFSQLQHLTRMQLTIPGLKSLPKLCSDYPQHLHTVILANCDQLTDVSPLQFIPEVSLYCCTSLIDVSPLTTNYTLEIIGCLKVVDYTICGKESKIIRFANMAPTAKFDITVFKQATRISIIDTPIDIIVEPLLGKVYRLDMSTSFQQLHCLKLEGVCGVASLEGCGSIPVINLKSLRELSSLHGLGPKNRVVTIEYCPHLTDFSPVQRVFQVSISYCHGFENGKDVCQVKRLSIIHCRRFLDVIDLGEVEELLFCGSRFIRNIQAIRNVPIVQLDCCSKALLSELGGELQQKIVIFLAGTNVDSSMEEIVGLFQASYCLTRANGKAIFLRKK